MEQVENQKHNIKSFPNVMIAIGGFFSSITIISNTVLFIWTIHEIVINQGGSYPNPLKIFIMFIGPFITVIHFVNASSILVSMLKTINKSDSNEDYEILRYENEIKFRNSDDVSFETEVFGKLFVTLRAIAGFLTVIGICIASFILTITIHQSATMGKSLPSDLVITIIVAGPILTSWTFMRAGTTINALLKNSGLKEYLRKKALDLLQKK